MVLNCDNILTYHVTSDCTSLSAFEIRYHIAHYGLDSGYLDFKISNPSCSYVDVEIVDGDGSFGSGFEKLTKTFEDQKYSWGCPVTQSINEMGSALFERVSFSKYKVHGRVVFDIPILNSDPKVIICIDKIYDVSNISNNLKRIGFYRGVAYYDVQKSPTLLRNRFDCPWGQTDEYFNNERYLDERSWYFCFDIVDNSLEELKLILTIIFSTFIGVGASIFIEAILSMELLSGLLSFFKKTGH